MGTTVIIVILILIALIVLGIIGKSKEKNTPKKKYSERDDLEFSEFTSVIDKKIIEIMDSGNNSLMTIYPAWASLLGVDDDGTVRVLDPNYSKKTIISKNFETEIEEINKELNGNFTYKFNIPVDIEINKIQVEKLETYHVLEFIDSLTEGFFVLKLSDFSKKNRVKFYIVNVNNEDEEISYNSAILVKNENGVNKSLTLSTNCITQEHNVKHLLKK